MKTVFNLLLFITLVSFKPKEIILQDSSITIKAIFDSYDEDDGYYFSYIDKDEDEQFISFNEISTKFLEKYNLESNEFIGSEFTLTYKEDDEMNLTLINIKILE